MNGSENGKKLFMNGSENGKSTRNKKGMPLHPTQKLNFKLTEH